METIKNNIMENVSLQTKLILDGFIEKAKSGKIFSVQFVKKNGEVRDMTARLGVKKHLKGGDKKYEPKTRGMLCVYDLQKEGYRTINFNTIKRIKMDGQTFVING